MIRAALLALLLSVQAGAAQCLLFCDEEILPPEQAAETFAADLGQPLPEGVTVLGMVNGGFQDRFIQVKLRAGDDAALQALLSALQVDPAALAAPEAAQLTITSAPFWDIEGAEDLRIATGTMAGFAHATVAVAPDPEDAGARFVYLIAFQT